MKLFACPVPGRDRLVETDVAEQRHMSAGKRDQQIFFTTLPVPELPIGVGDREVICRRLDRCCSRFAAFEQSHRDLFASIFLALEPGETIEFRSTEIRHQYPYDPPAYLRQQGRVIFVDDAIPSPSIRRIYVPG